MVLTPILLLAIIAGVSYFGANSADGARGEVAVVTASPEIQQTLEEAPTENKLIFDMDEEAARKALIDKKIKTYITVEENDEQIDLHYYDLEGEEYVNLQAEELALNSYQTAKLGQELGVDPSVMQMLSQDHLQKATTHLKTNQDGQITEATQDSMQEIVRLGIAFVVVIGSFMFIIYYIQLIGQELAREKGTRVMEIIISSMSATHHFFGKLLGIMMMIGTHIGIYVILTLGAWFANKKYHWIDFSILKNLDIATLIQENMDIVLWSIFFLLMSILIYVSLGAFFASMASTAEDAQKMNTPITLLMIVGYYIGMFSLNNPNNIVAKIGSYVPLWTPYVMPIRISKGGVLLYEKLLATGLSILFVLLCFALATTFYKTNVLTYSDKGIIGSFRRSFTLWQSERRAKRSAK